MLVVLRSSKNFRGVRSAPVEGERLLNDWRDLTSYYLNNPLVVVGKGIAATGIKRQNTYQRVTRDERCT